MKSLARFLFVYAVFSSTTSVFALDERVDIFPSENFDAKKVESRGLDVSVDGDSLLFVQETGGDWPQAVFPLPSNLSGCSRLHVEAENLGKDDLKIRFAVTPPEMPSDRDALMKLPNVELKEGEKKSLDIPIAGHPSPRPERLVVFVYQTGKARKFKITKVHGVGKEVVRVDASVNLGPRKEIEHYVNNSILMRSPPPELAARIVEEYGKPKIVRCWVRLDGLYDFKEKKYDFNYPIRNQVRGASADFEMRDVPFEEYLRAFAAASDEILLNVRGFERKVVEGDMPRAEYKAVCKAAARHYKTLCPNLRYIEALNEFHLQAFGNLTSKEYYEFYKIWYEVVGEINAELKPEIPLLVGGAATTGFPPDRHLREFVELYAADANPDKKLDFLSFHHYTNVHLNRAAGYESSLIDLLDKHGIPSDIPFFDDELGFTGSPWRITGQAAEDANRTQATCVTALQYFARNSRQLTMMPWVMFHSPSQTPLIQFKLDENGNLVMTPFGMTVKCWGMMKKNEIETESTGLRPDGFGLGAWGTSDETGIAVLLWNHQDYSRRVAVNIENIPEKTARKGWRMKRYLIDSTHSNCFAAGGKAVELSVVEEKNGKETSSVFSLELEPYAVTLILLAAEVEEKTKIPGVRVDRARY